jgi:hypothetical protein
LAKQKWNIYLVLTASPDTGIINDKKVHSFDFSPTITTVIIAPLKIAPEVIRRDIGEISRGNGSVVKSFLTKAPLHIASFHYF